MTRQQGPGALAFAAIILVLPAVFAVLLFISFPESFFTQLEDFLFIIGVFLFALLLSIPLTLRVFAEFAQQFYAISEAEARNLLNQLVLSMTPTLLPILEIHQGRVDLDGPEILQKLGGPGRLRIGHDTAVVTQRLGRLQRVLGPGLHVLEPFEKLWEIVDLRPQRRSIEVKFMTHDGIPICSTADIRFRVSAGDQTPTEQIPYPYAEQAVLAVATAKRVRGGDNCEGEDNHEDTYQDWTQIIAAEILDGVVRDTLEQHSLDDFLNPRHPHPRPSTGLSNSQFLRNLEGQIEDEVRRIGTQMGIDVMRVQLGPIIPADGAISQQWLEFWRKKLQRIVDERKLEGDAIYTDLSLQAQVSFKVELLTTMIDEVKLLTHEGEDIPTELIVLSFIDVLRTMTEQGDPLVQQQLDTLIRLLRNFM